MRAHIDATCETLGRMVGVSRQTVSYWEDETHAPTDLHLIKLVNIAKKARTPKEIAAALESSIGREATT